MNSRQKWIDHSFELPSDVGWTKNILCRINDTEIRLLHHVEDLEDFQLSHKPNDAWSIKEHIGHLTDLEGLWIERFEQFEKGSTELIGADMSNLKTENSGHNLKTIDLLISEFKSERDKLIKYYGNLSEKIQSNSSFHPRLKVQMKPVDLLNFVSEHDNHHITSISEIATKFKIDV